MTGIPYFSKCVSTSLTLAPAVVFNHVQQKLLVKGGDQTKLALRLDDPKEIVEKYVFAIDKSTGHGYFTKLSKFP